jgi:hypothetical protein
MILFKIVYWAAMVAEIILRAPYQKTAKTGVKTVRHISWTENILLVLLTVVMGVFPLIYTFTHWLDFANYSLPAWLGWRRSVGRFGVYFRPRPRRPEGQLVALS